MTFTAGVDLGGTNLRIAAYAQESGLLETIQLPTRLRDGRDAVCADMCQGIRRLLDRYSRQRSLTGIAIGSRDLSNCRQAGCGSLRIYRNGTGDRCSRNFVATVMSTA